VFTSALTVVIPCYKQGIFLRDCLESLQRQTYPHWRAIVVDDASPEKELIQTLVDTLQDSRIELIRHEFNKGLGAARNTGFSVAKTDFVIPIDADDQIDCHFLERITMAIAEQPQCDCVFTDFLLFGTETGLMRFRMRPMRDFSEVQWIPGPGATIRRTLWSAVGGYCEDTELRLGNEDWDFWIGAAERGFVPVHIPEPLYRYRRHPDSMMVKLSYFDYIHREIMYRRHRQWFDSLKAGNRFLAAGYLNSANESLKCGQRLRGLRCALQAWTRLRTTAPLKLALRALLPRSIIRLVKRRTVLRLGN
jgi:glycosyltransferase involved in cell wall biosynthesis